jgi:hypothetical protein
MAADNLRSLAIEQAGGIGHERLANWMAEHRPDTRGVIRDGQTHPVTLESVIGLFHQRATAEESPYALMPWTCTISTRPSGITSVIASKCNSTWLVRSKAR